MIAACSIAWCERPVFAGGLCAGHYERKRLGRDMDAPWKSAPRTCAIEGCPRPVEGGSFCGPHQAHRRTPPAGVKAVQFDPGLRAASRIAIHAGGERVGEIRYYADSQAIVARLGSWTRPGVRGMWWDARRYGKYAAFDRARAWAVRALEARGETVTRPTLAGGGVTLASPPGRPNTFNGPIAPRDFGASR